MAAKEKYLSHDGIITKITESSVFVRMIVKSACSTCDIKGSCSLSEVEEKVVEVNLKNHSYSVGQHVEIAIRSSLGYKALVLAYLIPFVVLFTSLIITNSITKNEVSSALIALLATAFYYLILFGFKNRLKKEYQYELRPN